MNLTEELEAAIGHGPPLPDAADRVAAGRAALRRRRVVGTVAAASVLAVLGTAYAVTAPALQGRTSDEVPVAPSPTASPSPSPTGEAGIPLGTWRGNTPVRYHDGELQIRPGAVVHERIENPFGFAPPRRSDAFDLTFRGYRAWAIVEYREGSSSYAATQPGNGWASFADWVADQVDDTEGTTGWPDTLRLADDGSVVASEGSEILQRTDDPRLGDTFAPPGTPTGAAVVRAGENGVGYFVVWRVVDGELDVITVPPRDVVGATFEQLLNYARGQYASGEGLR